MHTAKFNGSCWTIPAEKLKNGRVQRVPLPPLAIEIIDEEIADINRGRKMHADEQYSGYIFPCPHRAKDKPIERHAFSRALKRHESKDGPILGVAPFTPHDLRRTAATFMAEAGEMDEVIDALLNHAKQGIIRVYNQFKYDTQKQAALETWARKLEGIVTGEKADVIPMRRGRMG